jgi:hypothetical protein
MIPILSGNVASALPTGYEVANSVRFNDDDSAYMHFTPSSAGNRRTMTLSVWFKGTSLADGTNNILGQYNSSNENNSMLLTIESNGRIMVWNYTTSAYTMNLTTNRLLRDPSAWYHVVVAVDTTQSTDTDRVKIYVNGVQETSFFASTYPTQNLELFMNEDKAQNIGTQRFGSTVGSPFDGYMAEFCFIDGQQLAPTSFGEFDSDSPQIWKPIDVSGLTFGTNGYYLDFEDSSALGNDVSGNNNDFTTVNFAATDQSTDTCTNNFATLNPLFPNSGLTFSEGNLNVVASDANYRHAVSSMAVQNGKWYAEFKAVSGFSSVDKNVGIYRTDNAYSATTGLGNYTSGTTWAYGATGNVRTSNGNNDTGEATFTDGDIISIAMDLDNNKLYFAKNNSWINSGDPESGSTGTGAYAIVAGDFYHFAVTSISSGGAALWSCNFGSPSYANSSDAADANGYGAFEYAPPSGYLALCTKNLGSDGG